MHLIDGKPVRLEALSDTERSKLLNEAKTREWPILCGCQGLPDPANSRLSLHVRQREENLSLVKSRGTGPFHHRSCRHFELTPSTLAKLGYTADAIKTDEDDDAVLQLSVSLSNSKTAPILPKETFTFDGTTRVREVRPQVTPLGLLHFLWERSDLHRYTPGSNISARDVMLRLRDAARSTRLSGARKSHLGLEEFLLLHGAGKGIPKVITSNYDKLQKAMDKRKKVLCIALLQGPNGADFLTNDKGRASLKPLLNATVTSEENTTLLELLKGRFDPALTAYHRGSTLVVLAVASTHKVGNGAYAFLEKLVAMPVTKDWIPFESTYEQKLAEHLVAEGRAFEKPLRYDNKDLVFPDFILEDCARGKHALEVYGVAGRADYDARVEVKREIYRRDFPGVHWEWPAVDERDLLGWLKNNPLPARKA